MIELDTLSTYKPQPYWRVLLKNLLILISCTMIGGAIGWGSTFIPKPQWQASAQFDLPKANGLGNYYALANTYAFLQGHVGESVYSDITQQVFNEFKRNLTAGAVLQQFLLQSELVQQQAENQKKNLSELALELHSRFQFNEKNQRLTLILDNRETANQLLTEFITFATLQTREALNQELIEQWKVLFQQIKSAAENNLGSIQIGTQIAQQDWQGKLTLMKSVQPLDNQLIPYRLNQVPTTPLQPYSPNKLLWLMIGALSGLVLGLFLLSLRSVRQKLL